MLGVLFSRRCSAALAALVLGCSGPETQASRPSIAAAAIDPSETWVSASVTLVAGPVREELSRAQLGATLQEDGRAAPVGVRPFASPPATTVSPSAVEPGSTTGASLDTGEGPEPRIELHGDARTEAAGPPSADRQPMFSDEEASHPHHTTAAADPAPGGVLFDETAAQAFVSTLASRVNRPFAPGRIDFEARIAIPHQVGFAMDRHRALQALEAGLRAGLEVIELPVEVHIEERGRVPEGVAFDAVLGEWTTRFSRYGDYRNRGRNVRRATGHLNGAIIPAEGRLSFNTRVGERTRRRGYREAPVILRGELVDGMGGGVCQVSSTLYAAAFFSGLSFPEHTAHSRPSSYIRAGLDATVSWPGIDLVIENPFPFPLYVHATTEQNRLTVQLYGAEKRREVELSRRQGRWRPFDEETRDDPMLSFGIHEVTQEGKRGRTVFRTRTITEGDRTWVEEDEIVYRPVDRIVRVGTSHSFDLLFSNSSP